MYICNCCGAEIRYATPICFSTLDSFAITHFGIGSVLEMKLCIPCIVGYLQWLIDHLAIGSESLYLYMEAAAENGA
mgnify:CR=1 FL=1